MTLARELTRVFSQYRPKGGRWFGLLGQTADAGAEIEVSGRPGWYWVRVDRAGSGYQPGIFQARVGFRPLVNLPVVIEADPFTGVRYIVSVDQFMVEASGQTAVPALTLEEHATTHEWDGSDQLNWIHTLQIMNLRVQPGSVVRHVTVQGGAAVVDGEYVFKSGTTDLDLTSYWPTSGTRWILLTLSSTGVIAVQDDGALTLNALEPPAEGTIALAALPLRASATDLIWPDDFRVDLRFASATAAGIPVSSGNVWGTGYPAFDGARWAKIGQPEFPDSSTTITLWGLEAQDDTDYIFVGTEYISNDRADGIIAWGDNPADLLRVVFRETGESPLDVLTFHANGDVDLEVGSLILADGETVDGVDISAHAADTSAHHAPISLDVNADAILSLSTQTLGLDTQAANVVLAGPTSGTAAVPTMRGLVFADIPSSNNPGAAAAVLATNSSGQVTLALARIEHLGIGYEPSSSVGIYNQGTITATGWVCGMINVLDHNPSGDTDSVVIGALNRAQSHSGNNHSNVGGYYGTRSEIYWNSAAYLAGACGEYICISNNGSIGNIYGIYLENIAVGTYTNVWGLYLNGAEVHSYLQGNLLIGTTTDGMTAGGSLKVQNDFIHVGSTFESGDDTPKFGSYTLTIPATGTVALLGTANIFTALQTIQVGSTEALHVKDGSANTVVVVDTTNGRVGINSSSFFDTLTTLSVVKSGGAAYQDIISYRDSVNGGGLRIFHARGTESSPTSLNVGDIAGVIEWKGYGTSFGSMGQIRATVEGAQVGANGLPSSLDFCTIDSAGAVQLRVRMNSAGNMLIGTTADGLTAGGSLRVQKDFYMVDGWAGFGTAPVPGRRASYDLTTTDPAYHPMGSRYGVNITFTDNNSYTMYGLVDNSYVTVSASKTHSGQMFGMVLSNILTSTFAGTQDGAVYGLYAALTSQNGAAGTVSGTVSVISTAVGMIPTTTTAFTTIVGVDITAITAAVMSSATVTNVYGLRIGDISSGGTLNYAIYTGAGKVRFGDNVLIGTTTDGMTANGSLAIAKDLAHRGTKVGFFNISPTTKPTVSGSRGSNAALASLLTALAGLGLLTDSSTA